MLLKLMKLLIDADACPKKIKEIIFKAAITRQIQCIIVANQYIGHPHSEFIRFAVVDKGFDAADRHIIERCDDGDIVITSDIPLAKSVIDKGAFVINFQGKSYTTSNIGQVLALRDFYTQMRDAGLIESKNKAFSQKELNQFANVLDTQLGKLKK